MVKGTGKRTADTQQSQERFEGVGISTDWATFEKIGAARNDVEHYYPKLNRQALQGVVSSTFAIVRQFVSDELKLEPRELLGEPTWQVMLKVANVYDAEKTVCAESMAKVTWSSDAVKDGMDAIRCPDCGSDLLQPGQDSADWSGPILTCRACGASIEPDTYVPDAVESGLGWEARLAVSEGGEIPYTDCPSCNHDPYIIADQQCALYGDSVEHTCSMCANPIGAEELSASPLCGWCACQMAKDD